MALTKPRIIELLLITTVPTMFVAARRVPTLSLIVATLVGGALAAGGANAINMVVDRDIDALMERTKHRPLVTGEITPAAAMVFAVALETAAFVVLWTTVNLLSAVLAVSATAFYLGVYTMWLKRSSPQNIVIGGAAGAVPVLVGWSAVTGHLGVAPFVMFGVIFLWTPPHFWALAVRYRDDYEAAGRPDAPGGGDRRPHSVGDRRVQRAADAGLARPGAGGPHGPCLPSLGARAGRGLHGPGAEPEARGFVASGDRRVSVLDHLSHVAVRRHGCRRPRPRALTSVAVAPARPRGSWPCSHRHVDGRIDARWLGPQCGALYRAAAQTRRGRPGGHPRRGPCPRRCPPHGDHLLRLMVLAVPQRAPSDRPGGCE